jgi:collagenase-like PrtC family protease
MSIKKAEILAPAGDEDAALAAIFAGADAIYLGLSKFNARLKAANITEECLPPLVRLAHSHGVKIYVTANTLITTSEIDEFLALVRIVLRAGVDALIIQDYGALYLLKRLYPQAHIHASTQMTSHNSKQLEFLKRFAVRQVNLCREMSLAEIRELTEAGERMEMKVEVFVHGAYCISFSGQCLMSSLIGGHSANRGLCAQPCRKAYRLRLGEGGGGDRETGRRGDGKRRWEDGERGDGGKVRRTDVPLSQGEGERGKRRSYRLSLKDNNALEHASSLLEAGVGSLKIEGRLKNFYYVYQTVAAWREQLDRIYAGCSPNRDDPRVHKVFNRGFSAGYLENRICGQMFIDSPLDNSLTLVGEVKNYVADQHLLELTDCADLPTGIKINIYTPDNYFICTAAVEEKKAGNAFRIRLEHLMRDKILKGYVVFTLRDTDEMTGIQARLRHIKAMHIKERPMTGMSMRVRRSAVRVRVKGEEGQRLRAIFYSEHKSIAVESVLPLQRACKSPLTQGTLLEVFGKLGDTSFILESVDCSDLKGELFLPVSELNKLRRRAVSQLEPEAEEEEGVDPLELKATAKGRVDPTGDPPMQVPPLSKGRARAKYTAQGFLDHYRANPLPSPPEGEMVRVRGLTGRAFTAQCTEARARKSGLAILVSDLEEAVYFSTIARTVLLEINNAEGFQQAATCLSMYPNILPFFPAILFEKECSRLVQVLDKAICSRIVADNSGLGLAAAQKGIGWVAGPALNCANPYAVRALQEEGEAEGVFLSLELNARQIMDTWADSDGNLWMVVMGPLVLMTTRQCLLHDSSHCQKKWCDEQCLPSCRQYAVWCDELDMPFYVYKRPGAYTQVFNNAVLFIPEAVHLLRGRISHFVLDMRSFPFYQLALADKKKIMDYFARTLAGESGRDQDKKEPDKERRNKKGQHKNSQGKKEQDKRERGNKDRDKEAMKEILPRTTTGHFRRGL